MKHKKKRCLTMWRNQLFKNASSSELNRILLEKNKQYLILNIGSCFRLSVKNCAKT